MSQPDDILHYRGSLGRQRELFLLNFKAEFNAFDALDKALPRFASAIGASEILPFLQIMQRSARNAFESIAAGQSHQAWLLLRPFVEAPLIMGKWMDDPQNAVIWTSRNAGKNARQEYQDAYGGENIRSRSLPESDTIRHVLARLNDDFLQTNARYYARAVEFSPGRSRAGEFAEDPADHRAHLYAFLHLVAFVLRVTGKMFAQKHGDKPEFKVELEKLQREFAGAVAAVAQQNEIYRNVLATLGLWPHALVHTPKHG